jgi:saccharopine dehydrogenase-like NADP-dependent oxidoreductase
MWNTASSPQGQADYFMWTGADGANGLSAMARVTGSTAAIAAKMLAKGEIRETGIVAPEEALKGKAYEVFMKELEEREITVVERMLPIQA